MPGPDQSISAKGYVPDRLGRGPAPHLPRREPRDGLRTRRRKLNDQQRVETAESFAPGRKSAAEMARIFGVSQATVSRIVAEARAATA